METYAVAEEFMRFNVQENRLIGRDPILGELWFRNCTLRSHPQETEKFCHGSCRFFFFFSFLTLGISRNILTIFEFSIRFT